MTDTDPIPYVDYLELSGEPQLVTQACTQCGAQFFGRRNACAACSATTFVEKPVQRTGHISSFTIVSGKTPYVSAIVDCAGVSVRATVINVEADADHVHLAMPVQLTTYSAGHDADGREAIGYAFEPQTTAEETSI